MLSLTSPTFVILVRVGLVLAVLWVVIRWASSAPNTVFSVVRRLLSLLVVMVLAVLNVLVPINAEYGWYTSWGDVWNDVTGSAPFAQASAARGAPPATATEAGTGASPVASLPTTARDSLPLHLTPSTWGGYQTFTVPGRASHLSGQVTVWFPPDYTSGKARTSPVLEMFHGYLPAPLATFGVFHMDALLHGLSAKSRINPPLVVIPHWAPGRLDTECVNGGRPGDPAMETFVTQDVPAWVYEHFRVPASRESWATMGYSAGGWCSMMSTMLHPTTYSAAISLGGYAQPALDPPYIPFSKDSAAWRRYDLVALAKSRPPAVALWTLTSKPDRLSAPLAINAEARAPMSVTPTVLTTGSHRASVWEPYIGPSLDWLGHTSPGFAAPRRT